MQIKISFNSEKNIVLPIHYNNIVQGFIYNNIDEDLASFLHNKGFTINNRTFKLFTFSRILNRGKRENKHFNFGRKVEIIVSSPLDKFCKSLANHMLQSENLYLGNNIIKVDQIEILDNVITDDEIMIKTLSSIVAYSTLLRADGRKYTCYFMPGDPDFNRLITENLVKKYNVLNDTELTFNSELEVIPIGNMRQNIIYYKNFIVKGASGKFLIKGDRKLLQTGIDAGFGSKNSQGFGCVKIV